MLSYNIITNLTGDAFKSAFVCFCFDHLTKNAKCTDMTSTTF